MRVRFHEFRIGDVDDVAVMITFPIGEWQHTDHGKWVMRNATDITWNSRPDFLGLVVTVYGDLTDQQATEYFLRWPKKES